MKKLAVLLPTYNAVAYLNESIDSILNQTFADFDLYVYDDCSTDNTEEIISRYKDARLFYRKNIENSGIAKTLNNGLEELLPHYEYIARMDADDWAYPERFEKQIDYLDKKQDIVMCGTQGYWLKDIDQNPISGWGYPTSNEYIKCYLLFAASFGHSSVIFRSEPFQKKNVRYNETIETCEDWELWVRTVKMGQVANLPHFLMKYRILESSNHRSSQKVTTHLEERSEIISNYWADFKIVLSPRQVYEYYYGNKVISKAEFIKKIKILIEILNHLYMSSAENLVSAEKKNFSYMLARRLLDYWKRSKVCRIDPIIGFVILKEVSFMGKIKLLKSLIK
ncbi:glycosyltransferase family 2 protein [Flavobacterium gawalongense]|uniref:Glycosyltransferase family 2 protein n=1 Tax=Flavobacterium gawalongense TaxID=2594432 RepID=A0ABY3CQE8_9FLAO|nr:glycosyltransferase family A protein [Flavobacterium gawalongense]TRX04547.1 glycosyltransferase family 2 protein [Flavobacterium gawalongense]TRX10434.1 glycosyltransferase family 2 protein [Flavobacterium gawalongense]